MHIYTYLHTHVNILCNFNWEDLWNFLCFHLNRLNIALRNRIKHLKLIYEYNNSFRIGKKMLFQ